jgi:DNA-binding MarR family transcriptional regulator
MNSDNANRRTNKTLTNEIRSMIIHKYENGKCARDIAGDLEIKYSTVSAVISKYTKTGVCMSEKNKCEERRS